MYSIKKILTTTDFSEYSAEALDYAISIADMYQAELHVIHVVEGQAVEVADVIGRARKRLRQFVIDRVDESVWIIQAVRNGHPHEEIIKYAKELGIDLIVLATHGRTGLSYIIMGSIAEKVIRHSHVPVLTVKPQAVVERLVTEVDVVRNLHIGVD